MEKLVMMRSLYRSISRRSLGFVAPAATAAAPSTGRHHDHFARGIRYFHFSSPPSLPSNNRSPFAMGLGSMRCYSDGLTHLPDIKDSDIAHAFKELMAVNWDELPDSVVSKAKQAVSKSTEDKASQEALANVLRAAEAVEEFSGFLETLKMELDDSVGMSGEDVKPLSTEFADALKLAFERYNAYLDSFGPDEGYLRKKVEHELGIKMIHLKMRCKGLGADWGKVTVLGTSGLSGSYIEHRA